MLTIWTSLQFLAPLSTQCSSLAIVIVHCLVSCISHRDKEGNLFKNVLVPNKRAFIYAMYHHLVALFQNTLNYGPCVEIGLIWSKDSYKRYRAIIALLFSFGKE